MILLAQRKEDDEYGLKWEFPGGKVKENETGEDCIICELKEELGIDIEITGFFDKYVENDFIIFYYLVKRVSGKIILNAHEKVQWVFLNELNNYDLLSVDHEVAHKLSQRAHT